jgi:hypothetical protein
MSWDMPSLLILKKECDIFLMPAQLVDVEPVRGRTAPSLPIVACFGYAVY